MNNKQKAIAIGGGLGTFGAEALIGGLGIGMLGTAIAVPASAVVATVSVIAWLAAGDDTSLETKLASKSTDQITDRELSNHMVKELVKAVITKNTPDPDVKSFILKKGTITHKITVNSLRNIAYSCLQATSVASWTNYQYFNNIQAGRDFYKSLLVKGYVAA